MRNAYRRDTVNLIQERRLVIYEKQWTLNAFLISLLWDFNFIPLISLLWEKPDLLT